MISRRNLLAVSGLGVAATVSAAKAASFGNPDEPPQGAINAKGPRNLVDPGPQNPVIGGQFPSAPGICNDQTQFFEYVGKTGKPPWIKMAGWLQPPA